MAPTPVQRMEKNEFAGPAYINGYDAQGAEDGGVMPCGDDGFPICIPPELKRAYAHKGVRRLFEWQTKCLSDKELYSPDFANLIYTAPTGGGKTMIAEILAVCNVLRTGRRAIFAFPFISNAKEKLVFLQNVWRSVGIKLKGFIGGDSHGLYRWKGAICTYEKAAGLLNQFIEANELDQIGVVVIDELHMVFESDRGGVVENLVNKILYINATNRGSKIQIIGMSATLPEYRLMAEWTKAKMFSTDFRPVELREFLLMDNSVYDIESMQKERELDSKYLIKSDSLSMLGITVEALMEEKSVLIFCPTKFEVEANANLIALYVHHCVNKAQNRFTARFASIFVKEKQEAAVDYFAAKTSCNDKKLLSCIRYGVSWHHAGLTVEEREQIEYLFHQGTVKVLCATTTLSSGVNLPAHRVLIRASAKSNAPYALTPITYKQMVGRAGRPGIDKVLKGESYLLCTSADWPAVAKQIEKRDHGRPQRKMTRAILEGICSELVKTGSELRTFLDCTFSQPLLTPEDDINKLIQLRVIARGREGEKGGVDSLLPTQFGRAILGSTLDMDSAVRIYNDLENAMRSLCIDTEIHMLFLVTPIKSSLEAKNIDWHFYYGLWSKLGEAEARVASRVGVNEAFFMKRLGGNTSTGDELNLHIRFFVALILHDLVNEEQLEVVSAKYKINKGVLQGLQQSTASYAFMICAFCDRLGWSYLKSLLEEFAERLQFGVRKDLTELVRVPEIDAVRARAFHANGIKSLKKLHEASTDEIRKILRSTVKFVKGHPSAEDGKNTWLFGRGMMDDVTAAEFLQEAALEAIQERIEYTIGVPNMMLQMIDEHLEKSANSFLSSNRWNTDDDESILHRSQLDEICDSMSPMVIREILDEPVETTQAVLPPHIAQISVVQSPNNAEQIKQKGKPVGKKPRASAVSKNDANHNCSGDPDTQSPLAKRPNRSSPSSKDASSSSSSNHPSQTPKKSQERFELLHSGADGDIQLRFLCKCNNEKLLGSVNECGMSFVGTKEVLIHTGESNFLIVELAGKCKICNQAVSGGAGDEASSPGVELIASILEDERIRKWLPDELIFMRSACLRKHYVNKAREQAAATSSTHIQQPCNLGCARTLITLDEDDCNKKTTVQDFAKKCTLPAWLNEMMRAPGSPRVEASIDAYLALHLSNTLLAAGAASLRQQQLHRIYLDSVEVIMATELNGFAFDVEKCGIMEKFINTEAEKKEREIFKEAGEKWNLDSPKATSQVLYGHMKLEPPTNASSTKTHLSTKSEVLKQIDHPIAALIIKYRTLEHALAVLRGLRMDAKTPDGRIRTVFDSNNVHSGRISSTDPNLHSLGKEPIAGGNSIRSLMVAEIDNVLLAADYNQLELRMMCAITQDSALMKMFDAADAPGGKDVFEEMASRFKDGVTRDKAKQLCYAIIYGMGAERLSNELKITKQEAQELIEQFFELFPKVKSWMDEKTEEGVKTQVCETHLGRKRTLPREQERGESKTGRVCANYMVQGSAAELFRKALFDVNKAIKEASGRIVNQVHDEIIVEVPKKQANKCAQLLKAAMEGTYADQFPQPKFPVKLRIGRTWGSLEKY